MQDLSDDERKDVLGEVLFDELRAIRESLDDVPKRDEFIELKEKVESIDIRTTTIEHAIKDQSRQQNDLENRVQIIEQSA